MEIAPSFYPLATVVVEHVPVDDPTRLIQEYVGCCSLGFASNLQSYDFTAEQAAIDRFECMKQESEARIRREIEAREERERRRAAEEAEVSAIYATLRKTSAESVARAGADVDSAADPCRGAHASGRPIDQPAVQSATAPCNTTVRCAPI